MARPQVYRLALADLLHDRLVSFCQLALLVALFSPLLLLFSLKYGIVTDLLDVPATVVKPARTPFVALVEMTRVTTGPGVRISITVIAKKPANKDQFMRCSPSRIRVSCR